MSEDEAQVQSEQSEEEEEETTTPKKGGRGRPKKGATPASGEHELSRSFRANAVIEKLESMLTAFKGSLWGHPVTPGSSVPQLGHILVHHEVPGPSSSTSVALTTPGAAASTGDLISIERSPSPLPCAVAVAAEEDITTGAPLLQHLAAAAAAGDPTRNEPDQEHTPEQWYSPNTTQRATPVPFVQEHPEQVPQEPLQIVADFPAVPPPLAEAKIEGEFGKVIVQEETSSLQQWPTPAPFVQEHPEQLSQQFVEFPGAPPLAEAPPIESEFKVPPLPAVFDTGFFLPPQPSIAALSPTPSSTSSSTDLQFADPLQHHQQQDNQFVTNIEINTTFGEDQFQPAQNFQFAASDFDFLLSKGGGGVGSGRDPAVEAPRDSLLLKFDPLLKAAPAAALINSSQHQQRLSVTREETPEEVGVGGGGELQELPDFAEGVIEISSSSNPLPPIIVETAPAAEDGEGKSPDPQQQQESNVVGELGGGGVLLTGLETSGFIAVAAVSPSACTIGMSMNVDEEAKNPQPHCADDEEADEKMSVDNTMILDGGESSSSLAERNMSYMEADQDFNGTGGGVSLNNTNELDKKSKNESLKIEELQKKLSEAELREEALLKRITDKDKTISKMSGVVEAYERAIADLITQKEQTTQSYEKTCEALKTDSDINAQHLESLEKTFSDLHAKYERMKVITVEYKEREEELINERNRFEESLRMQEKRYENMKSHAMSQLEIANTKLADLVRNHAQEVTKLKALLKKEEIYRASVNEQLSQKSRENEELVKICEELINGGAN